VAEATKLAKSLENERDQLKIDMQKTSAGTFYHFTVSAFSFLIVLLRRKCGKNIITTKGPQSCIREPDANAR
jgi:hypothetical protein